MVLCKAHRDELKAEIVKRGMGELISADAGEAMTKIFTCIPGDIATFDPYIEAHSAIVSAAVEMAGLTLFMPGPDGFPCPLCTLIRVHAENPDKCIGSDCTFEEDMRQWIPSAADACRKAVDEMASTGRPS